ncbi:MAG: hypothetical protein U5R49_27495 [Deltaproteobacteria bacterium]|nr:hypothetical protein [Deltaproteobacteria bacterium]
MAVNFHVDTDTGTNGELCLKLSGDFDGTSALELADLLNIYAKSTHRIFLDTNGLKEVWAFGRAVFADACAGLQEVRSGATELVVTGEKLTL